MPQLTLTSRSIFAPTGGYDPAITNGGEFAAQVGLSYLVYDGGLKRTLFKKSGVLIEQQNTQLNITLADVVFQTSLAFTQAVKEKRELAVLEENAVALRDYLQIARDLQASGQVGETDVLKAEVRLNNSLVSINAKNSSQRNALLTLSQTAGFTQTDSIDVDTTWFSTLSDTIFNIGSSIDIVSARLLEQSAVLEAQAIKAQFKPTFTVSADAGALTSNPNLRGHFSNVLGGSVGVNLALPLFTFNAIQDRFISAQFMVKSIAERNRYLERSLTTQFTQVHNNMLQGQQQIIALEQNLKIAGQNLVLSKAKYLGGGGSSIEVLDAIQIITDIYIAIQDLKYEVAVNAFTMQRLNFTGSGR